MNGIYRNCVPALLFFCLVCSCKKDHVPPVYVPRVSIIPAKEQILSEEVSGFGNLSFLTKVDINASQDGVIQRLYYREGAIVPRGAKIADLHNPQIELAVGRAENVKTQAIAALKLARSRLLEGEFAAEAEILNIAKAEAEFAQARKTLEEQRRKAENEETLYNAGGLSDEAIRENRFSLSASEEQLRLMERDMEIRTVGLRDRDLKAAGLYPQGGFASETERRNALVQLSVSTLKAEAEAAEAQLEAAVKELESVQIARSELTIYSPAAGTVGARYLEEGERAKKEDKILTLMDTGALYVIFPLREQEALRLRKDMAAKIKVDGAGDVYDGTVDLVAPQADSQSFTFNVRALLSRQVLAAAGDKLKPGMFARVTVLLGNERQGILVPDSAILNRKNGEGTVFVVNQNRASLRQIRFGELSGDEREILSGLKPGEAVIRKPDASIKEGSHVIPET